MLREFFIWRKPSHFQVNPVVKAFIISETILWFSWSAIMPIFAIFVANKITGGNAEIAASSYSAHLIVRVIFDLFSGKILCRSSDFKKFMISIIGIILMSLGYFGFAFTHSVYQIYLFYILIGIGLGIASPAKNCLFSTHLDKNKETTEWSFYDATALMGMAISATIGGFLVTNYGFHLLFFIVGIINLFSIIPYIFISKSNKN